MAVTFTPQRGAILMCDFERAFVPPEMPKMRQAIVISIKDMNHRYAKAAGICTLVPVSSKRPKDQGPEDVLIPLGKYWSFSLDSWAKCSMICCMSHERLDLVLRGGRRHPSEFLDEADMQRISAAVRHVLDLA